MRNKESSVIGISHGAHIPHNKPIPRGICPILQFTRLEIPALKISVIAQIELIDTYDMRKLPFFVKIWHGSIFVYTISIAATVNGVPLVPMRALQAFEF